MIWGEALVRLVGRCPGKERMGRGYVSMFSGFCYGLVLDGNPLPRYDSLGCCGREGKVPCMVSEREIVLFHANHLARDVTAENFSPATDSMLLALS